MLYFDPVRDYESIIFGTAPKKLAVILYLRDVFSDSGATLEQLRKAVDDAGGIKKNSIVFCMMGKTQYFSTEAIRWWWTLARS